MSDVPVLSLALCLFKGVTALDFQGPIELFSFISPENLAKGYIPGKPAFAIEPVYFAVSMDPVQPDAGPTLNPTRTYDSVKPGEQFDIILIPGGMYLCACLCNSVIALFLRYRNSS